MAVFDIILGNLIAKPADQQFFAIRAVGIFLEGTGDISDINILQANLFSNAICLFEFVNRSGWQILQFKGRHKAAKMHGHIIA